MADLFRRPRLLEVQLSPGRVYVLGRRLHHGFAGLLIGGALMAHDRRDWRVWIVDALRHPATRRR
jgi:hypothetical protein